MDIANLLSFYNYSVITIADIDDALKIAQNISFDIILCCSFTHSSIFSISKLRKILPKLRTNLYTQHCPILACFSSSISAYNIHELVKQGVDCCYIFKSEIRQSDNENKLINIVRYAIKQTKENYGFLKHLLSDFN
ncbi:MAG: hypothetical protein F6K62_14840 [Sphaerospermopsis sp. SIO1G2]|nr:hypothetical protein [Sphaerospermopsis sp. SIO1G1]NET72159.1 hypothetical protein [Sphaerospermopsis sp. SIO1G2]